MIERIADMPAGTVGFRAAGRVDRDDLAGVLLPALEEALRGDATLRMLHELGPDLEEVDPRRLWAEVRDANPLGMEHLGRIERTAVAAGEGWGRRAATRYGWMLPGEFKLFGATESDAARRWLAR